MERPNAHTGYAFQAAQEEAERCGITLPKDHDHAFDDGRLNQELREYEECDYLLCPSEFVMRTFLESGIPSSKILRHRYGYDHDRFFDRKEAAVSDDKAGATVIYAGVCEPRKGLHFILDAWFKSGAHQDSRLRICGGFVPGYAESLKEKLEHPSIEVLGHRNDLPELMRKSDVFVLSSVEEGSALVTYEAMGSGCVLLVSDATGAPCVHEETGLIHRATDAEGLANHLTQVRKDIGLRNSLREKSVEFSKELTWEKAGVVLLQAYDSALEKEAAKNVEQMV